MSEVEECCIFCCNSKLYSTKNEENAYYLYNIMNACKRHLPPETVQSVKWDLVDGCPKLCGMCYENTKELIKQSLLLDKIQIELKEVARKISLRISQGQNILYSQSSDVFYTPTILKHNHQGKNNRRILPRVDKNSDSSDSSSVSNNVNSEDSQSGHSGHVFVHKIGTKSINFVGSPIYFCETCGLNFEDNEALLRHIKGDESSGSNSSNQLKCSKCPMTFSFRSNLQIHLKSHDIEVQMPYKCGDCQHRFATVLSLKHHSMKLHSKELILKCPFCLTSFDDTAEMSNHKTLHDNRNPMKCYLCTRVFVKPEYFKQHLDVHNMLASSKKLKNAIAKSKETVKLKKDDGLNHKTISETEKVKTKCCGRKLAKSSLKNHRRICKSKKPELEKTECNSAKNSSHSQCYVCKKMFLTEEYLNNHMEGYHNVGVNRKFRCNKCLYDFEDDDSYSNHLVKHSSDKHECSSCEMVFSSACQMMGHFRCRHTGEIMRDYKCSNCDSTFRSNILLQRHQEQNRFCNGKLELGEVEADFNYVEMEAEEDTTDCYDYEDEKNSLEMDELQNMEIKVECFDPEGNDNYIEIKADPGVYDTYFEDMNNDST